MSFQRQPTFAERALRLDVSAEPMELVVDRDDKLVDINDTF